MRALLASLALVCALVFLLGGLDAGEKGKEVTLKGKITCAKCDLGVEKKCATVIVTKEGGKDQVYYFDKTNHGKYHKDTCQAAKDGEVTGTVSEQGGKKVVMVKSLKYKD